MYFYAEHTPATTIVLDLERVQVPDRDLAHLPICEWCLQRVPQATECAPLEWPVGQYAELCASCEDGCAGALAGE
jgi:hypothetical protein